jgi:hypothetical protein
MLKSYLFLPDGVIIGAHNMHVPLVKPQPVHHAHFVRMRFFRTTVTTHEGSYQIPENFDVNGLDVPLYG